MNNDLISREALRKSLKSNCDLCHDKNTNWCEHCCPLNDFEDLIDNAPTIEPEVKKVPIASVTFDTEKMKELTDGIVERIKSGEIVLQDERQKGEWINEFDSLKCPFCGMAIDDEVHWLYSKEFDFNFCPNCGAQMDMRGEEE